MGKKKIDIEYIDNYSSRRITFKTRLPGLLKKIQDISTLCGLQVSLAMTDCSGDIVVYSNNSDIQLLCKSSFNQNKQDFGVRVFTPEQVSYFSHIHQCIY